MQKLKLEIEVKGLVIPLRYYRGWKMFFRVDTETFECPLLSVFGHTSGRDCEVAIEAALKRRGQESK